MCERDEADSVMPAICFRASQEAREWGAGGSAGERQAEE